MIVVERCTKILESLFGDIELSVQNDRVDSKKVSFMHKGSRLLEIAIISEEKNIFRYNAEFKLVASILNRAQARIKRNQVLTIQKYQYNLGNILTTKYLNPNVESINESIYTQVDKTINLTLDLSKITGAFISEESLAYISDTDSVNYTKLPVFSLVMDNKIYPIKISPIVLEDTMLCSSIVEALINNNLKDDMMVSF